MNVKIDGKLEHDLANNEYNAETNNKNSIIRANFHPRLFRVSKWEGTGNEVAFEFCEKHFF